ncbi:type I secretion system permease/ATPase [Motiliproteus sp. SC1-56]|uniref:type I secretion system permease/ATPase n=1 Tax=Motiliproteus sp. SC1-56 TaxID=2799565 RepID=UPI001A90304C|nr:type I secretion system permease/ATPase [Motiliproteus sp. SC1-56]
MVSHDRPSLSPLLSHLRRPLGYALSFSVFVNLMLLGPALYMLQVFDRVLSSRSEATLAMLTLGVALPLLAMSLVDAARARLLIDVAKKIDERLAEPVLRRIIRRSSSPAPEAPSSGLRDVATLRTFLAGPSILALFDAPWMIAFVAVIYLFHPALGAIALGGAVLLMLLAWASERTNRRTLTELANTSAQASRLIDQGIRNADVINGMGMASTFAERWHGENAKALTLMQQSGNRGSTFLAITKFLRQSTQVAMMGTGAWLVIDASVTPGVMIAGTILFGRAMAPVEALIGNWNGLVGARDAWSRLDTLLAEGADEPERTPLPTPQGRLQVEQVALPGIHADAPILRQVDFTLAAGKSLGILGPSGAGKSSLGKILVGIWRPGAGKVRIDGAELHHWDPDLLGPHLGYLPQDVELFPGTVADNIARFQPGAGEEVVEAARLAHAYAMILKLPQGFDTRVGEGGIRLSAGQAQRIGLARALFRSPKIIVLDEPNANLDTEGEQALVHALQQMQRQGTTLVMVTHKPALVATLDYLLVMREGRVEMMGPREPVLARLGEAGAPQPLRSAQEVSA